MDDVRAEVRPATLADVDAIAHMVAAAFATDPAWSFMIPPDRADAREAFARAARPAHSSSDGVGHR